MKRFYGEEKDNHFTHLTQTRNQDIYWSFIDGNLSSSSNSDSVTIKGRGKSGRVFLYTIA